MTQSERILTWITATTVVTVLLAGMLSAGYYGFRVHVEKPPTAALLWTLTVIAAMVFVATIFLRLTTVRPATTFAESSTKGCLLRQLYRAMRIGGITFSVAGAVEGAVLTATPFAADPTTHIVGVSINSGVVLAFLLDEHIPETPERPEAATTSVLLAIEVVVLCFITLMLTPGIIPR